MRGQAFMDRYDQHKAALRRNLWFKACFDMDGAKDVSSVMPLGPILGDFGHFFYSIEFRGADRLPAWAFSLDGVDGPAMKIRQAQASKRHSPIARS